jgi:hypothetical protein
MADQDAQRGSFWTSLPGILTGAAALITAISGLAIWHSNSGSQPAPQPAPVIQQQVTPQPTAPLPASTTAAAVPTSASTAPEGSQAWCAEKYKAWADEKAQSGVDDAGLRKEIIGHHCNTQYGFVLGKVKEQR